MKQTNGFGIHEDYNIMKWQASITSIVNTVNKLSITQMVYCGFKSPLFDEKQNKENKDQFNLFIRQHLDGIEHTSLIAEWTYNMDTAEYIIQEKRIC